MKKLSVLLAVVFLVGCNNLHRRPERWALVLDADTNQPVADCPLVYTELRKPYWIVSYFIESQTYPSDKNGLAHVPLDVRMQPRRTWTLWEVENGLIRLFEQVEVEGEASTIDIHGKKDVEVIYVREGAPAVYLDLPEEVEKAIKDSQGIPSVEVEAPRWPGETAALKDAF